MAPGPVPYIDGEGGGPNPPYGEDFFQRIVGVHWREPKATTVGTVFVIGTLKGGVYYTSSDGSDVLGGILPLQRGGLPVPSLHGFPKLIGSSAANVGGKPIFLVCGVGSDDNGPPPATVQFYAFICASNDGVTWRQVFKGPQGSTTDHVGLQQPWTSDSFALVWNPTRKAFFYSMYMDKSTGYSDQRYVHELIYSSPDGNRWRETSDRDIESSGASTFPSTYCSQNNCFDGLGQHVPDGIMHEDKSVGFLIRPTDPPTIEYSGFGSVAWGGTSTVEMINAPLLLDSVIAVPVNQVTCVAGISTVWMAGGFNDPVGDTGAVAFSFDAGNTWKGSLAVDSGVVTMLAVPTSGFPAKPIP
jgi:hypothetical protein